MTNKIKAKPRDLWLAELESGEYQQGKGLLRYTPNEDEDVTRYCCLGVACEAYIKAGHTDLQRGDHGGYDWVDSDVPHHENGVLPERVRRWLGLRDSNPTLPITAADGGEDQLSASGLNDYHEYTFQQIADAIRRLEVK